VRPAAPRTERSEAKRCERSAQTRKVGTGDE
jgi:hypothetical protein